jgi:hypothetical protein
MPVFDFGDWPDVITAIPGFRILATMYYPDHEARRQELHATLVAAYGLRAAEEPAAWARPLAAADLLPILHARHDGRSVEDVWRAARELGTQGSVAGDVLVWMRRMIAHGVKASVSKACYLQAELGKTAQHTDTVAYTHGLTEIPYTTIGSILRRVWPRYKSVAAFWAAHNLMVNIGYHLQSTLDQEPDPLGAPMPPMLSWFEEPHTFREFLALAEDFRRFGEAYTAHPASLPTLDTRCTWRVPAHVYLPDLVPFEPAPLPPEIRAVLTRYHAVSTPEPVNHRATKKIKKSRR